MSNVPFYMRRHAPTYGGHTLEDGIVLDGLWDVYDNIHMGTCAEKTAQDYSISREEPVSFAISSYKKSASANEKGILKTEITPVTVYQEKEENQMLWLVKMKNFKKLILTNLVS